MPVYSRKWEQLGRNQIPLLRSWHNLQCNSGLLLAKHVLVFLPPEVLPSLNCRSNSLLLREKVPHYPGNRWGLAVPHIKNGSPQGVVETPAGAFVSSLSLKV